MKLLDDQVSLTQTTVANILDVIRLSLKDSEHLYDFHLDTPKKEEEQNVNTLI